jgi:formamidopyrimidine-DNA glycosylase
MPELPEVENIRLQLDKYLIGHTVEKVEIRYVRCFEGDKKKITGCKVQSIRRFGKVLVVDLSDDYSLVIHIKMSGQLIYTGPNLSSKGGLFNKRENFKLSPKVKGGVPGKHTHVVFHLSKSGKLYYNDYRKFGWIKVMPTGQVEKTGFVSKLGPEPLSGLTFEKFKEILSNTKRPIKVVLMDQSKIGGIGNIYANDALWLAGIDPERKANELSPAEQDSLFTAIEEVLRKGLKYGGASKNMFVRPDGTEGEYQSHFLVYGRMGQFCKRCRKEMIVKKMVAGRGTYFCPKCQK